MAAQKYPNPNSGQPNDAWYEVGFNAQWFLTNSTFAGTSVNGAQTDTVSDPEQQPRDETTGQFVSKD
jgi:hypothetical protein